MTKLFFVRHAQPEHSWDDDRTRPLTDEGLSDTEKVLEFFKVLSVDCFYMPTHCYDDTCYSCVMAEEFIFLF